MKRSLSTSFVSAILASACSAHAQPIETLTFSIEWENDVTPTNPTAKGAVWATISPEIGAAVAWNTGAGKGQAATLLAFAFSLFDTINSKNGSTGTLAWTVPNKVNGPNKQGTPDGNGGITGTLSGQFAPPLNYDPILDQKVKLLGLAWTTNDFSSRSVEFATRVAWGKVYIEVPGISAWIGEGAVVADGSGGFLVVPVPPVLGVLMALVAAARRRRT